MEGKDLRQREQCSQPGTPAPEQARGWPEPEGHFRQPAGLGQPLGGCLPHSSAASLPYLLRFLGPFPPRPPHLPSPALSHPLLHCFTFLSSSSSPASTSLLSFCLLSPHSSDHSLIHPPHPSLFTCSQPAPYATLNLGLPHTAPSLFQLQSSIRSSWIWRKQTQANFIGDSG